MKRCTKCGIEKPIAEFNKRNRSNDGLSSRCRACLQEYLHAYRAQLYSNPPQRTAPIEKQCARCRETKPAAEFSPYIHNRDGLLGYCRECSRSYANAAFHGPNHDQFLARNRQSYHRHGDYNRQISRTYQQSHRPEHARRSREWRKRNMEQVRHFRRMRQAREKNAPGTYGRAEWQAMCDWFGPACLRCGSIEFLTVDHVMPLALGGANSIENLQPLCLTCNKRKNDSYADYRDNGELAAFLASLG